MFSFSTETRTVHLQLYRSCLVCEIRQSFEHFSGILLYTTELLLINEKIVQVQTVLIVQVPECHKCPIARVPECPSSAFRVLKCLGGAPSQCPSPWVSFERLSSAQRNFRLAMFFLFLLYLYNIFQGREKHVILCAIFRLSALLDLKIFKSSF